MSDEALNQRCAEIADRVVPKYRGDRPYSCTGHIAKQWSAAYEAARLVLDRRTDR